MVSKWTKKYPVVDLYGMKASDENSREMMRKFGVANAKGPDLGRRSSMTKSPICDSRLQDLKQNSSRKH